jgi:tetratricopeptide (TPR) repeat protein
VFAGGADLGAIGAVAVASDELIAPDAFALVADLVDASLLYVNETSQGEPRFAMLQIVRAFALDQLRAAGDADDASLRHRRHYLGVALELSPLLNGDRHVEARALLEEEADNFREALRSALALAGSPGAEDDGVAIRLAGALWQYWHQAGAITEGRRWLEAVLQHPNPHLRREMLTVYSGAGTLAFQQGDYDEATRLHQEALRLARQVGDRSAEALALNNLGAQVLERHDVPEAQRLYRRAEELAVSVGDHRVTGMSVHNAGEVALHEGDYDRAASLFTRALGLFRQSGDQWLVAAALHSLALTTLQQGHIDEAREALRESLELATILGGDLLLPEGIEGLASVAAHSDQPRKAVRLLAAASRLRSRMGTPLEAADVPDHDRLLAELKADLPHGTFERAWRQGQHITAKAAIAEGSRP